MIDKKPIAAAASKKKKKVKKKSGGKNLKEIERKRWFFRRADEMCLEIY